MTIEELIDSLKGILDGKFDPEMNHMDADELLLKFINHDGVKLAFEAISKWYA